MTNALSRRRFLEISGGTAATLLAPQDLFGQTPGAIRGIRLSELQSRGIAAAACRYSLVWHFDRRFATVWPKGWSNGYRADSPQKVLEQDQILGKYGIAMDFVQFNPNIPGDLLRLERNYFGVSERARVPLYEHHFGTRYVRDADGRFNLSHPNNRRVFLDDTEFMLKRFILADPGKALINDEGRAFIYIWVPQLFSGNIRSVIAEAKRNYPVAFIGGRIGALGEDPENVLPEAAAWIEALDIIAYYSLGLEEEYVEMWRSYLRHMSRLRERVDLISPETQIWPTFWPAFDDHLQEDRNNPRILPNREREVTGFLKKIRQAYRPPLSAKDVEAGGVEDRKWTFDAGLVLIWDETLEGGAVIPARLSAVGLFYEEMGIRREDFLKDERVLQWIKKYTLDRYVRRWLK